MLTGPAALILVAALLAQGGLVLVLLVRLGMVRVPMITRGEVKIRDIALDRAGWPEHERKLSNAFDNQFQLPVLFYAAAILALLFTATWLEALLAWAFVVSRIVHATIHVTTNNVVRRFYAYAVGFALLSLFWLDLLVRLVVLALDIA